MNKEREKDVEPPQRNASFDKHNQRGCCSLSAAFPSLSLALSLFFLSVFLLLHLQYPHFTLLSSPYPLVPFLLTHTKSKLHQCGSIHSNVCSCSAHTDEALHLFGFVFSPLLNTCVALLSSSNLVTAQHVIQQKGYTIHTYELCDLLISFICQMTHH